MKLDNNSRFTIFKDAYSYLEKNKAYDPSFDSKIADKKDFGITYNWDKDFKNYFRWNFNKIIEISKYYSELDLFLKNIYWEKVYSNLETTIKSIITKTNDSVESWNSLFVINLSPLEMVITWKIFEELWAKNIVYNFNRQPVINSASKTFEAFLYLAAYKKSSYFKTKNSEIISKLWLESFKEDINNSFFIFDENNSLANYNYHDIDDYLKWQTGFSIPKNVYRLDKYPDKNFLESKQIKQVVFFDTDNDLWEIAKYYIDSLKKEKLWLEFKTHKFRLNNFKNIWYYEDYLISKNKDYLNYKKTINLKTQKTYSSLDKYINSSSLKKKTTLSSKEKNKIEQKKKVILLLIVFPFLFIAFLIADTSWGPIIWNSNWTTFISSNSSFWSLWSSSSSASSTKSSSSLIKSFWWGGISKGSSSS